MHERYKAKPGKAARLSLGRKEGAESVSTKDDARW